MANKLRALVEQWRNDALITGIRLKSETLRNCADALSALLAQAGAPEDEQHEIVQLRAELARLAPYVHHKDTCQQVSWRRGAFDTPQVLNDQPCTCGLRPLPGSLEDAQPENG